MRGGEGEDGEGGKGTGGEGEGRGEEGGEKERGGECYWTGEQGDWKGFVTCKGDLGRLVVFIFFRVLI